MITGNNSENKCHICEKTFIYLLLQKGLMLMLSTNQLMTFRENLLEEKSNLENLLHTSNHFGITSGHTHESTGELSSYDNHPADEGTDLFEREKDIALNEHTEKQLNTVNNALRAMDTGTYGICEKCGVPIPLERLEVLPMTTYCKEHTPDQNIPNHRSVEESVLAHSFGNDSDFPRPGRDTFKEVAEYGTSETISDTNDLYIYAKDETSIENMVAVDMYGKSVRVAPNSESDKIN